VKGKGTYELQILRNQKRKGCLRSRIIRRGGSGGVEALFLGKLVRRMGEFSGYINQGFLLCRN